MDFNYENLSKYIEIAEEVIRGLGGAAVNTVQFLDVMAKEYGITPPDALLAADTADSLSFRESVCFSTRVLFFS